MAGNSRGARLEVTLDTLGIDAAMLRLSDRYDLLSKLTHLVQEQSRERFETQIDPEGQKWVEWSPVYVRKARPKGSILNQTGALKQSIGSQIFSPENAVVGTKLSYAKIHQYGGKSKEGWAIPARPFMGVSDDQKTELQALCQTWIQRAVRNG